MPEMREKIPGDRVRLLAPNAAEIEDNWQLVRYEPDSGNAILEREGTRVNVTRENFLLLNFPGSDDLYACLRRTYARDPAAENAIKAWASNDLKTVRRDLIDIINRNATDFLGVQNASDFSKKLVEREEAVDRGISILKLEIGRSKQEYDRFDARTSFERDKKDNLLLRFRNFEDQYSTKLFEKNILFPVWQELFRALSALEYKLR
jgi:hypothetical protein